MSVSCKGELRLDPCTPKPLNPKPAGTTLHPKHLKP